MKTEIIALIFIIGGCIFLIACGNDSQSGSGENVAIDGDWSRSGDKTLYGLTFDSDGNCTGLRVDSTSSYRYYRQTGSWEASEGSLTVSVQSCERSEDGKEWISSSSCSSFTRNYFIKNSVLVLYTGDGSDEDDDAEYWVHGRSGILPDDLPQPPFEEQFSSSSTKNSEKSSSSFFSSDSIKSLLIGTWSTSEGDEYQTLTDSIRFESNGSIFSGTHFSSEDEENFTKGSGQWSIANGDLVITYDNGDFNASADGENWIVIPAMFSASFYHVLVLDDTLLVVYSGDGSDDEDALGYYVKGSSGKLPDNLPQPPFPGNASNFSITSPILNSGLNPEISYGTLKDDRDNQTYKTVAIGTQIWMAQNLNYADSMETNNLSRSSWCYEKNETNCEKYGRLYTWTAAMNLNSDYSQKKWGDDSRRQGICPDGWHIPSGMEWRTLYDYAKSHTGNEETWTSLMSTSGWSGNSSGGTDLFGFSALPAGGSYTGDFYNKGIETEFWSSMENEGYNEEEMALLFMLSPYEIQLSNEYKDSGWSIRCLKN